MSMLDLECEFITFKNLVFLMHGWLFCDNLEWPVRGSRHS